MALGRAPGTAASLCRRWPRGVAGGSPGTRRWPCIVLPSPAPPAAVEGAMRSSSNSRSAPLGSLSLRHQSSFRASVHDRLVPHSLQVAREGQLAKPHWPQSHTRTSTLTASAFPAAESEEVGAETGRVGRTWAAGGGGGGGSGCAAARRARSRCSASTYLLPSVGFVEDLPPPCGRPPRPPPPGGPGSVAMAVPPVSTPPLVT